MRVVLDTNVLLSGFAYPASAPGRIVNAWRSGSIQIVVSRFILDELARTLPRLSNRTGFNAADCRDFVDALSVMTELVEPDEATLALAVAARLRDPTDVPVLAAFMATDADYLVTGDRDLLALVDTHSIISPADFCARHAP
jgi:putative PIN family toxin of toxin-antitoxin system